MNGLMMDWPLLIPSILARATRLFPEREIVSRDDSGNLRRLTYAQLGQRVRRLMTALQALGVKPGDRVATFAWNHHEHLELYFAVPSLGAVLHTVNIRLPHEQLCYIINHAKDSLIFFDRSLGETMASLQPSLPSVEHFIAMDPRGASPARLPHPVLEYDRLLEGSLECTTPPTLNENDAAGLCYTSGTTGDPKGVLYSHRSTFLHAMASCMVDSLALREAEVVLPVVPMFHVNAWGLPYSCTMAGAKQVFPGSQVCGQTIAELVEKERVTIAAGVPTVWRLLHQQLTTQQHDVSSLHTVLLGGAAAPRPLVECYERDFGIKVLHAWGMTEMSPLGTVSRLKASMSDWSEDRQLDIRLKQGLPAIGVETRIIDQHGSDLPWDGTSTGELIVRGPWVASAYYENSGAADSFTADGWFRTGDIANIDPDGYVKITDRVKDLIKRKGEWISSLDMEALVMTHPCVSEAAVVARADELADEIPVLFVVIHKDAANPVEAAHLLELLGRSYACWQLPKCEDCHFVDALPKTSVGKLDKKALRRIVAESFARPTASS